MPLNRNTLMRLRTIDACLRRRQRRWTLEALRKECENALYEYEGIKGVSLRTIQRDIELMRSDKLGYNAPIVVRDKKYYEYEDPDYSITQKPLSKEDLAELNSAMDIIRHYHGFQSMKGQEDILTRMQDQIDAQEGHQQIVYLETVEKAKGLGFLSPLYNHIAKKEHIVVDYHSFKASNDTRFYVSPYALCEFNSRWFLIAYSDTLKNFQTIALDRIVAVRKSDDGVFCENTFYKMERYLGEMVGVTRDLSSRPAMVKLKVDAVMAPYMITKPMHKSQHVDKTLDDGSIIMSLQVVLNFELQRKIIGFAHHMEVLSPPQLRRDVQRQLKKAWGMYQGSEELRKQEKKERQKAKNG